MNLKLFRGGFVGPCRPSRSGGEVSVGGEGDGAMAVGERGWE